MDTDYRIRTLLEKKASFIQKEMDCKGVTYAQAEEEYEHVYNDDYIRLLELQKNDY